MAKRPVTIESLSASAAWYVERYGGTSHRLQKALLRRIDRALPDAERAPLVAEVERIVGRYVQSGMIDDRAWAASRAERLVSRGVAPSVVRQRLAAESLDARAALAEVEGDADLRAACAYVRRRRLGPFRLQADLQGDLAKMARAGFSYAVARKVLAMSVDEVLEGR